MITVLDTHAAIHFNSLAACQDGSPCRMLEVLIRFILQLIKVWVEGQGQGFGAKAFQKTEKRISFPPVFSLFLSTDLGVGSGLGN